MQSDINSLPDFDSPYPVTLEQAAAYRNDGHVLLRSVATTEDVRACRPIITGAAARYRTETRPIEQRDTYGRAFLQIMNLWENDAGCAKFVMARRFAGIAAGLMGVESVRLYHDQALFKEGGGGHTPWHQDQYYWPLAEDTTITMWMPLVEATEQMGTMTFASGSHKKGYLGTLEISDESEAYFERYVQEHGFRLAACGAMAAGDASFHSGWTLHSAPGNATSTVREAFTIIYFADGMRIQEPDNKNRWDDLARWFPGQKPGELAASPLNPVVYP